MEKGATLVDHPAERGDRLNRPDLMISEADTDQYGFRSHPCGQVLRSDSPSVIYGERSHRKSLTGKHPQGFQDRRMLNRRSDDVCPLAAYRPQYAAQG